MSDVHVDAAASEISPDAVTFASLPLPLACLIFLALPVDARGRACCVCRAWRDALADPSLWTRLDMSFEASSERRRFDTVLRGAAGRAHGQLFHLDLSQRDVERDELLPVLTANAGSLRELHLHCMDISEEHLLTVKAVMAAAPLLQVLTTVDTHCWCVDVARVLRAEPPFAPLQLRSSLNVGNSHSLDGIENFGPFTAALADAALQPALSRLCLWYMELSAAVVGALMDAALARRLRELAFENCTPLVAAPLARLLAEGSLAVLEIDSAEYGRPLFDLAGAALVADALRVNKTLTVLRLEGADLCVDMRVAGALLGALVGHPSLRVLVITFEERIAAEHRAAFGAALAALLAADALALQVLDCSANSLGDVGLAPIVEALVLNHHLLTLCLRVNFWSEAFAREQLLPAVRENTTLRELVACFRDHDPMSAAAEAEELVRRRWQHA